MFVLRRVFIVVIALLAIVIIALRRVVFSLSGIMLRDAGRVTETAASARRTAVMGTLVVIAIAGGLVLLTAASHI